MAIIQHVDLPSHLCHEPKHISTATTNDSGKVITPSSTNSGTSQLRYLKIEEIDSGSIPSGMSLVSDGAGSFTWAASAAVEAYSSLASQVMPSIGSWSKIPFTSIDYSMDAQGNSWVMSSNSLTVPEDGTYVVEFTLSAKYESLGNGNQRFFEIDKETPGSSTNGRFNIYFPAAGSSEQGQDTYGNTSGSRVLECVQGDPISLYVFDTSGIVVERATLSVRKVG